MDLELPLVSIGIPTYNRPEGLRRALDCITKQSYKNLEIIVSDNCSDNTEVVKVIEEFAARDKRIASIRQDQNIGIANNFTFVLAKATGEYFMWAADDDYWDFSFIEEMVANIGTHSACFCSYQIVDGNGNYLNDVEIVSSAAGNTKYQQLKNFFLERVPSLVYGVYVRQHLLWYIETNILYDWSDCFVIQKIILDYNGYGLHKKRLYKAGVRQKTERLRSLNPKESRLFEYSTYVLNSIKLIFSSRLNVSEKAKLLWLLIDVNFRSFIVLERNKRRFYWIYFIIFRLYDALVPRPPYKRLY